MNQTPQTELFVKMVISSWVAQNKQVDKLLDELPEDQWFKPTAPGRNSGHYLLGHLASVNDALLPLLGFGDKIHPELHKPFIEDPEKTSPAPISLAVLKQCWKEINKKLVESMERIKPEDWFARHNSVSPEDFLREPHRNKLNVLINRSIHQAYHLGQLAYLRQRE